MDVQTLDDTKLKEIMKRAFLEILEERKDVFINLFAEAIEDIGMAQAIKEGELTSLVAREKIFKYLDAEK